MEENLLNKQLRNKLVSLTLIIVMLFGVTALAALGRAVGINNDSIIMLYLLGVLFSSFLTHKYIMGVVSAILNALSFSFFFNEPIYSLKLISTNDIIFFIFFIITAVTGSAVVLRLTREKQIASNNEASAKMLYEISKEFIHITGKDEIIERGIKYVEEHCECYAEVKIHEDNKRYLGKNDSLEKIVSFDDPIIDSSGTIGILTIRCTTIGIKEKHELMYKAAAAQIGAALEREDLYSQRESIRFAMETEKNKSTLLRSIAHDIRSPLTAISGASNLLAERYNVLSDEERNKLAIGISEESVWLTNLVENILNMTRITQSKLDINKEYEVIDDIIAEVMKRMERLWGERIHHVSYPDEVIALYIDGKLIAQVLINLLDNAVKFTKNDDEITLSISVNEHNAIFMVSNTGEPIPDEIKKNIFEVFFTSKRVSTDARRGVGLGLPICRAIVEAHNGEIWVEDNQPSGAKFIFIIPKEA